MATQLDPSWLPSTVAQSTAALVAIVGGFMVSRFISIDSEMAGARRRLEEAEERYRTTLERKTHTEEAMTRRLAREFLTDHQRIETLISTDALPTAEQLLDEEDCGLSAEQLRPHLEEALAVVTKLRPVFDAFPAQIDFPPWGSVRRALKIAIDEWDLLRSELYDRITHEKEVIARAEKRAKERKTNLFGFSMDLIEPVFPGLPALGTISAARDRSAMDRLRDQRDQIDRDLAVAIAELGLARRAVVVIGQPRGLILSLWVLSILTVLGLAVPVIELANEPLGGDATARWTILVCFLVGLTLLLGYLWIYALVLRSRNRKRNAPGKPSHAGDSEVSVSADE
jgi:hypothetical protein